MKPLNKNDGLMLSIVIVIVSPGLILLRDKRILTGAAETWGNDPWFGNFVVQTDSGAPSGNAKVTVNDTIKVKRQAKFNIINTFSYFEISTKLNKSWLNSLYFIPNLIDLIEYAKLKSTAERLYIAWKIKLHVW